MKLAKGIKWNPVTKTKCFRLLSKAFCCSKRSGPDLRLEGSTFLDPLSMTAQGAELAAKEWVEPDTVSHGAAAACTSKKSQLIEIPT